MNPIRHVGAHAAGKGTTTSSVESDRNWRRWIRPQIGILLLAALAPYDGVLLIVPHGGTVHGWQEALTLVTLAATLLTTRQSRVRARGGLPPWVLPLGGLIVLGLLWSFFVGVAQAKTGFRIDFFYVLLALAVWRAPLNERERDWLVTILMVDGIVTAVVGIAQQALGVTRLHQLGYAYNTVIRTSHGHLRSFSTFAQPFPFGFYLMAVVLVGLPVALADPRRLRNRVFLFSLPLLGLGMFITIVRGAWLGVAVGLLYLGIRRYRKLLWFVPLAVVAGVAVLVLPGNLAGSVLSSTSLHQRFTSWDHNLNHVLRRPLGTGIGSSGAAALQTADLTGSHAHPFQPDNYYFKEIYELGVPGLLLFIWLIAAAFWDADRTATRIRGPDSALALGVAAAVLAAAAASTVATYFEIYPMDLMFWLLIAVVATCPTSPITA
jgi:putative inorganic carbon (HCO3(-)) transporter